MRRGGRAATGDFDFCLSICECISLFDRDRISSFFLCRHHQHHHIELRMNIGKDDEGQRCVSMYG